MLDAAATTGELVLIVLMTQFLDREAAIQHVLHDDTPRRPAESDDDDGQVSAKAAGSGTGRRAAKGKRKLIYSDDESDSDISLDDPLRKKATMKSNSETKNDRADESTSDLVLKELQRSNDLLSALVKRIEKSEKRLNLVEDKLESAGSSSGDSTPKTAKKKDVPIEVGVSKVW